MSISFFSPICKNHNSPVEKLAFLSSTTDFFNFGQPKYTIRLFDSQIFLEEKAGSNPHWIKTLLRIVAICTIIIPLIMCVDIWIYRRTNNFKVYVPNRLNTLPLEILKFIYENAGPACLLNLASTSKTNHALIESENSFKQYRFILKAMEQIPLDGNSDEGAIDIIGFTKILCALDLKLAFLMAESINNSHALSCYKSDALATYVKVLAPINPNEALKVADTIINLNYKAIAFASVAECFFASDPKKSKELAELAFALVRNKNKKTVETTITDWQTTHLLALVAISKAFVKISCPKRAQEISDFIFEKVKEWGGRDYGYLLMAHIKALVESDCRKTLEILEPAIKKAILDNNSRLLAKFAKIFIIKAPEKALFLIKKVISILNFMNYPNSLAIYKILRSLCKLLPDLNEQNSLEVTELIIDFVNTMPTERAALYKAKIYCHLAHIIYRFNPIESQNLVDLANIEASAIENEHIKFLVMIHIANIIGLSNPKKAQDLIQELIILNDINDSYFHSSNTSSLARALFPLNPEEAIEKLNTIVQNSTTKSKTLMQIGLAALSPNIYRF